MSSRLIGSSLWKSSFWKKKFDYLVTTRCLSLWTGKGRVKLQLWCKLVASLRNSRKLIPSPFLSPFPFVYTPFRFSFSLFFVSIWTKCSNNLSFFLRGLNLSAFFLSLCRCNMPSFSMVYLLYQSKLYLLMMIDGDYSLMLFWLKFFFFSIPLLLFFPFVTTLQFSSFK